MANSDSLGELYDDRALSSAGERQGSARPIGTPLSTGGKSRGLQADARRFAQAAAPDRSLPAQPPAESTAAALPAGEDASVNNLQRALQGFRLALPFVQKLLPLLDGHVATVVSNLLSPQPAAPAQSQGATQPRPLTTAPAPQHITVDLTPVEEGLKRLQNSHRELHVQVAEQNTSIRRVEDQLAMVREATDRNTLEQQELMEDLKGIGKKVNVVTLVVLAMLLGSVLLNLILYLHMQRVLP
jgi:hypothetical protein